MEFSFPRALARTRLSAATQKKGDSMKKAIVVLILVAAASWTFAQTAAPAPQSQITVGGGWYDTDATGALALNNNGKSGTNAGADTNPAANKFGQTDRYSPSFNLNGNYVFTMPLNAANILKFGLGADWWDGYGYTGGVTNDADTILVGGTNGYTGSNASSLSSSYGGGQSGQNAGKVNLSGEYQGYGFDALLSLPLYYYSAADNGGYNDFKYAYSEAAYMPTNDPNYPANGNNLIFGADLKLAYKYSIDKTTWVSVSVDTLATITPTPWLTFVKPDVSAGFAGFQLDLQFDYFNGYYDLSKVDAGRGNGSYANPASWNQYGADNYYDTFLEPKLTYDFGFMGVKGLKAYVAAKISLATSQAQYNATAANYTGYPYPSGNAFLNTSLTPDVSYTFTVPSVGTFMVEGAFKIYRLGDSGSDQYVNPPTYYEPQLKASYTLKF